LQLTLEMVCTGQRRLLFLRTVTELLQSQKSRALKNIVCFAREIIHLLSELLSGFIAEHNLAFNLLQTIKITTSCRNIVSCFFDRIYVFSPARRREN
jgi:hypothetical protein